LGIPTHPHHHPYPHLPIPLPMMDKHGQEGEGMRSDKLGSIGMPSTMD